MRPSALFFLWTWCALRLATSENIPVQPKVALSRGTIVSGFTDQKYSSVRQFLGIPYAEPPIEELRWEAPRANRLPRALNATSLGSSCTQFFGDIPNLFNRDILEYNIGDANATGEDCLTLSIWAPERAKNLPIIVFFYGGGWYTGGQNVPYQIPTQWVQRTQDLIVVVPNFRGNIFGFPNAQGAQEQNLGLLDQRLAVKWIRDNIRSFGGDPRKITIWGQSSGAESVDIWSFAWYEDLIVNGLIMDSGTAFIEDIFNGGVLGPKYSNFSYVASHFGCGNTKSPAEELLCMKKVDAASIEAFLLENYNNESIPSLAFGPAADEKIVFANWTDRVRQGKISKVPAIIGVNKEDGNVFSPYNSTGQPDQTISDYWFLNLFLCPSYRTSKLRVDAGIQTYRYLYAGNFSNISPKPWMGAYHGSEQPLLFGTHGNYRGPSTKLEIAVSEAMQDAWRAFANDPQRGLENQNWPQFTSTRDIVRWFGENGTVAQNIVDGLKAYEDQC